MKKPSWKKIDWGHYQLQAHDGTVLGTIRENHKTGWWHTFRGKRGEFLGRFGIFNDARNRIKEAVLAGDS